MTVYLVGAGPGDPGLMTARALELIEAADVIIHDRLIPANALDGARADAQLIYAGKQGGGEQVPQAEITRLLVEHGRAGGVVVRLKGGDPFVFGRGGEEAEALVAAGIAFEVVPGVTAGIAASAYAGIPVTHRDLASSVAFLTGHEDPGKAGSALDWPALAAFPGTLVVYMGVRHLQAIAARLIAAGRPGEEPAAVVQSGTLPDQRTVVGTTATIAALAAEAGIGAPAIAIFGPVAALHEQLRWLERRPLHGVSVAVTRAREQGSGLAARLQALGASVVLAPVIRTELLPGPPPELEAYDLICFTSPTGVQALFARLHAAGLDARAFPGGGRAKVAAIGPATARALLAHGIRADIVPAQAVGEALAQALAGQAVTRALVARAREARDVVPDALRAQGAEVDVVAVYETVVEPLDELTLEEIAAADYITFTAASTVRNFLAAAGGAQAWVDRGPARPRVVSIGPVTSAELRAQGLSPDIEAQSHDIDGLVDALLGA